MVLSSVYFIKIINVGFTKSTTRNKFIPAFANHSPVSGPRKANVDGKKYEVSTIARLISVVMI